MSNLLLTPEEVAERLRLHSRTVYEHLRAGTIPAVKIGGSWRIDARQLDALFTSKSLERAVDHES
jgi:excisionase family DNA binding protein